MTIAELRRLGELKDIPAALDVTARLLARIPDCPYLLVRRGILIQLGDDEDDGLTLADAERCLLEANATDPMYLPALEELAHFYDAVRPHPQRARNYAQRYIQEAKPILEAMQSIASGQDEAN